MRLVRVAGYSCALAAFGAASSTSAETMFEVKYSVLSAAGRTLDAGSYAFVSDGLRFDDNGDASWSTDAQPIVLSSRFGDVILNDASVSVTSGPDGHSLAKSFELTNTTEQRIRLEVLSGTLDLGSIEGASGWGESTVEVRSNRDDAPTVYPIDGFGWHARFNGDGSPGSGEVFLQHHAQPIVAGEISVEETEASPAPKGVEVLPFPRLVKNINTSFAVTLEGSGTIVGESRFEVIPAPASGILVTTGLVLVSRRRR